MNKLDGDIALGMCFNVNDEKLFANATPAADNKLSEPNFCVVRYTSCSRPDERAVINAEERTILLQSSPEPIPYEVRLSTA